MMLLFSSGKLNDIDDPILLNTVGVQLFGMQFEDLEAGVIPVLAGMKDSTFSIRMIFLFLRLNYILEKKNLLN